MMLIQKKKWRKMICALPHTERLELARGLIEMSNHKLHSDLLDVRIKKDLQKTISRVLQTEKIGDVGLYKLYLASVLSVSKLNYWVFRGSQVYRSNKPARTKYIKSRRPSIYGWSGQVIPRTFLDKAYPHWVETQCDYDRYMEKKYKMSKTEFQQKVLGMWGKA